MKKTLLPFLLALFIPAPLPAQPAAAEAQAAALFERFLVAMTNADTATVTSLFADDALFWGTGSQALVTDPAGVAAYFAPVGRLEPGANLSRARDYETRALGDDLVMISGVWEVVPRGQDSGTPLRVSMLLSRRGGEWKVIQFHNSRVPE